MLVATSVIALSINTSIQDNRVAYITVKVDKVSYDAGENITFQLASITEGVDFNITDQGNEYGSNSGGVNIIGIPDTMDPYELLDDAASIYDLNRMLLWGANELATIHYGYFNSTDGPLTLSWNGTARVHSLVNYTYSFYTATSGYYLIVPDLEMAQDEHLVFVLDENAIFYYNSMDVLIDITNNPDTNVTVDLSLKAPSGTDGNMVCDIYTTLQYHDYTDENSSYQDSFHMYNQTGVVITADQAVHVIFTHSARIPDHGYPEEGGGVSYSFLNFEGTIVTPSGNYTFYFTGRWDGGWEDVAQY